MRAWKTKYQPLGRKSLLGRNTSAVLMTTLECQNKLVGHDLLTRQITEVSVQTKQLPRHLRNALIKKLFANACILYYHLFSKCLTKRKRFQKTASISCSNFNSKFNLTVRQQLEKINWLSSNNKVKQSFFVTTIDTQKRLAPSYEKRFLNAMSGIFLLFCF